MQGRDPNRWYADVDAHEEKPQGPRGHRSRRQRPVGRERGDKERQHRSEPQPRHHEVQQVLQPGQAPQISPARWLAENIKEFNH